jgi:hypothetical protein
VANENEVTLPRATGKGRPEETNCNIAVYGDHGGGKTTWVEEVLLKNKKRLIIIDTLGKDYGSPEVCKATGVRYDGVVTDLREFFTAVAHLAGKDGKGNYRIVARCQGHEMEIMKLFVFDQGKKRATLTDTTIVIEEISRFMDQNGIDPAIEDHLTLGRHSRNNLVGVAQIPVKQTNTLYRAAMDMFISFRQTEDVALSFFNDFSREKAEELRHLETGDYRLFRGSPEKLMEFIRTP